MAFRKWRLFLKRLSYCPFAKHKPQKKKATAILVETECGKCKPRLNNLPKYSSLQLLQQLKEEIYIHQITIPF